MKVKTSWLPVALVALLTACGNGQSGEEVEAVPSTETEQEQEAAPAVPQEHLPGLLEPRTSDFDGMVDLRVIRVLVTHNRTHFFFDGGRQRGIVADALLELEKALNDELKLGARKLHVAAIPVKRDQLIQIVFTVLLLHDTVADIRHHAAEDDLNGLPGAPTYA